VSSHTAILIVGPTAVGKTAIAIALAKTFQTEIISADSRQCYREMNIGVARPSIEELESIPHHFIASHSIHDDVNAGLYETFALQKADMLFKQHSVVVVCGGTGLYIKAFCDGIDDMPQIDPAIRQQLNDSYAEKGMQWLQNEVALRDPHFWQMAEQQNPHRLLRALEVLEGTGKSITDFRIGKKAERHFKILKIGLEMERSVLNEKINLRVEKMMQDGLLNEVKSLYPYKNLNALQTVGYQEIVDHLDGKISLENAIALIKQHTRQYAKRQMTWFKKDNSIHWVNAAEEPLVQIKKILLEQGLF
jgi:tRNA dimethylallyltransferase